MDGKSFSIKLFCKIGIGRWSLSSYFTFASFEFLSRSHPHVHRRAYGHTHAGAHSRRTQEQRELSYLLALHNEIWSQYVQNAGVHINGRSQRKGGIWTSQIVSSDFAPCVVTEQDSILQEQSGGNTTGVLVQLQTDQTIELGTMTLKMLQLLRIQSSSGQKKQNILTTLFCRHANYFCNFIALLCYWSVQFKHHSNADTRHFKRFLHVYASNIQPLSCCCVDSFHAWHCCTFIYFITYCISRWSLPAGSGWTGLVHLPLENILIPLPSCQKLLGARPKLLPHFFFKPPFSTRRFTGQFGATEILRWCSFAGGVFHDIPIKHITLVTRPFFGSFQRLVGFVLCKRDIQLWKCNLNDTQIASIIQDPMNTN